MVPDNCSTVSLTTAMPTPRPLARSASSRVEKPGAQSSDSSAAASSGPGGTGRPDGARPRRDRRRIDAATVVGDLDRDDLADGRGAEHDRAFGTLAGGDALLRRFDSVADGVAHQMKHRIHHPLDQVLVDLG